MEYKNENGNFNLSKWLFVMAPLNLTALTPDEAIHLRDRLNEHIDLQKKQHESEWLEFS